MSKSKILLKVAGSIAAYKSADLVSKLLHRGHEVRVVASPSALRFVGEATYEGLTGQRVYSETFQPGEMMSHIHLMRWADLVITAPATANYINKCAAGIGDDLLSTLFLAHNFDKPYLIAPAMNSSMYNHPITQASIAKLQSLGLQVLATDTGGLACGEVGVGRLLETAELIDAIEKALVGSETENHQNEQAAQPLAPLVRRAEIRRKILVTSGGTKEPVDQVRHIGNASSGRTGSLLARAFTLAGHQVTYLHAEDGIRAPECERQLAFTSFVSLDETLKALLAEEDFDVIVHAAAVSDFSISHLENDNGQKILESGKISSDRGLKLVLKPNHKIIDQLKTYSKNKSVQLIGFKLTSFASHEFVFSATKKIFGGSGASAVVHNDTAEISPEQGQHPFHLYLAGAVTPIECPNIEELARQLCRLIEAGSPNWNELEGELL